MTTTIEKVANDTPADVIQFHGEQIRAGLYDEIGRVWAIVLEAAAGAAVPTKAVTDSQGVRLDFYGLESVKGRNLLPRIATTKDKRSLLLLDPILDQDGRPGLPAIPDPTWKPSTPKAEEICWDPSKHRKGAKPPVYKPAAAPMIPQKISDRARGKLRDTEFLILGPIAQILVRPEGLATGIILQCGADLRGGRAMELLVDHRNGQSFFFGGRYQIVVPQGG
jgi:hypothetical protein